MEKITYKLENINNREVMVSTVPASTWEGEDQFGYQTLILYPAFLNGRCWVLSQKHQPKPEYMGDGDYIEIISFEKGIEYLVREEVFNFPIP